MNILQVTGFPNNGAGSGTLITTQAEGFVKQGHNICTILSENRTDFPRVPGVKYHPVLFTAESENPEKIEGQLDFNFPMFTTHTRSTSTFWNLNLDQIKAIEEKYRHAIKEEADIFKPDVIHGQHNWIHSAIAAEFNIPLIITIHGTDLMGYKRSLETLRDLRPNLKKGNLSAKELQDLKAQSEIYFHFVEMAKKAAKAAQRIIVISEDQKQQFCELFPEAADKVVLVKNGYNPDIFHVMEDVDKDSLFDSLTSDRSEDGKLPKDYDNMALFVGKFADFKGIDVLLDATKKNEEACEKEGKKLLTVVVGTGALEPELKAQAENLGLKNLHFVGLQGHDVIRQLQNLADISVVPSRKEPFGLVVIEGTACGHPVVATNSGGIPDIMNTTGKTIKEHYNPETDSKDPSILAPNAGTKGTYTTDLGMLVPVDDSDELSRAMMDIFDGRVTFDNDAIAKYTKDTYSQEAINTELLDIFSQAVKSYNKQSGQNGDEEVKIPKRVVGGPSLDDDL